MSLCRPVALYQPPDPINHVYSLPGKQISNFFFTYPSIQIFKILFRGFFSQKSIENLILRTRSYGTALITQHSWLLHFRQAEICLVEMICTKVVPTVVVVPASKGHLGGASPQIFLHNSQGRADMYMQICTHICVLILCVLVVCSSYIYAHIYIYAHMHTYICVLIIRVLIVCSSYICVHMQICTYICALILCAIYTLIYLGAHKDHACAWTYIYIYACTHVL